MSSNGFHLEHAGDGDHDACDGRERTRDRGSLVHRQNESHRVDAHVAGDLGHHFDERIEGSAVGARDDGHERRDGDEEDGHADGTRTHVVGDVDDRVEHAERLEAFGEDTGGDHEGDHARERLAHRLQEDLEARGDLVVVAAPADHFADHADDHAQKHQGRDVKLDRGDAVLGEDDHQNHREERQEGVDLRCGGARTLHVLGEDERLAFVLLAVPAFATVKPALPEDVREADGEHGRNTGRNLEEEDVVENRQVAGLGGGGRRAAEQHERAGARRDEHGANRLLVDAERGKRGTHERQTEHAEAHGRGDHHRDGLAEHEGDEDQDVRIPDDGKRLDRDVHEGVVGADVRHVGGKAHHRHDQEAEAGKTVREHVADELDDVQIVVARRQRLLGHERARIEEDCARKHEGAACKEHERSILALDDGPPHDDECETADQNTDHDVSPVDCRSASPHAERTAPFF